jgi:hypothetical protein
MQQKYRTVVRLAVREGPGTGHKRLSTQFDVGTIVTVRSSSRREADGYIWWQHDAGWSAEGTIDGRQVFMMAITAEPETPPPASGQQFRSLVRLSVRVAPSLFASRQPDTEIQPGQIITVRPDSRRESDDYIWWQHETGWSAEGRIDGTVTFLAPLVSTEPGDPVTPADPIEPVHGETCSFKVLKRLSIRAEPGLSAPRRGTLLPGMLLEAEEDSRCEADGFIWWHHMQGWSAEKAVDESVVFLGHPDTNPVESVSGNMNVDALPRLGTLFQRVPVDLAQTVWVQYFGNTRFAFSNGQNFNYPVFAQGLHSGLDFGSPNYAGIQVYAGVTGEFVRNDGFGVVVRSGEYVIVYQHLVNTDTFTPGGVVTPDTLIGTFDPSLRSNTHLHLEVRYDGENWIVNPLLFLPPAITTAITRRFSDFDQHFYSDENWQQWLTPLDQPVILRGGPLIGPTAM